MRKVTRTFCALLIVCLLIFAGAAADVVYIEGEMIEVETAVYQSPDGFAVNVDTSLFEVNQTDGAVTITPLVIANGMTAVLTLTADVCESPADYAQQAYEAAGGQAPDGLSWYMTDYALDACTFFINGKLLEEHLIVFAAERALHAVIVCSTEVEEGFGARMRAMAGTLRPLLGGACHVCLPGDILPPITAYRDVVLNAEETPFILYGTQTLQALTLYEVCFHPETELATTQVLLSCGDLPVGSALRLTALLPEGYPTLMVSFLAEGVEQRYLITQSGMDGSMLLMPISDLFPGL